MPLNFPEASQQSAEVTTPQAATAKKRKAVPAGRTASAAAKKAKAVTGPTPAANADDELAVDTEGAAREYRLEVQEDAVWEAAQGPRTVYKAADTSKPTGPKMESCSCIEGNPCAEPVGIGCPLDMGSDLAPPRRRQLKDTDVSRFNEIVKGLRR